MNSSLVTETFTFFVTVNVSEEVNNNNILLYVWMLNKKIHLCEKLMKVGVCQTVQRCVIMYLVPMHDSVIFARRTALLTLRRVVYRRLNRMHVLRGNELTPTVYGDISTRTVLPCFTTMILRRTVLRGSCTIPPRYRPSPITDGMVMYSVIFDTGIGQH